MDACSECARRQIPVFLHLVSKETTMRKYQTRQWDIAITADICSGSGCFIYWERKWNSYSDLCAAVCPIHTCHSNNLDIFRKSNAESLLKVALLEPSNG